MFDSNRKISIPFLPRNIGVITSPTGAVIEDIKRIIFDRFPARIVLWPVSVQGSNSENQIIQAITGFNEIKNNEDKPDVIIIARGGGSTEDLVTFNGERLVRSIFESKIPIISAIGHESDNSLCDYVADLRVSTPSAAAEAVVPLKVDMLEKIKYTGKNLNKNILRYIEFLYNEISNLNFQLIHPSEKINIMGRNLQISREKLIRAKNAIISLKKYSLETKVSKLKKPSENIKLYSEQLKNLTSIIFTLNEKKMVMAKQRLISLENILKANSYEKILDRGFVLVESPDGSLIRTAEKAINYSNIHLKFMDGYVSVKVDSKIKK